jgi:hypothetical protein
MGKLKAAFQRMRAGSDEAKANRAKLAAKISKRKYPQGQMSSIPLVGTDGKPNPKYRVQK